MIRVEKFVKRKSCSILIVFALCLLFSGCNKKQPFSSDVRAAIENNKTATLKVLIDAGADVNARDETGTTPLNAAVHSNARLETTKMLLESGADPNQPDDEDEYPLNIACQHGDVANATLLLKQGADPNHANREGLSALAFVEPFLSSQPGVAIVDALLQKGAKADGESGARALKAAFRRGNVPVAKMLMGAGARVESNYGAGFLHGAVNTGNYEMVDLLLDSGVNPNSSTPGDYPNLFLAAFNGSCQYRNGKYAEIVELLVSKGANVDVSVREPTNTPLALAEGCVAQYGGTPQSRAIIHALQRSGVSAPLVATTATSTAPVATAATPAVMLDAVTKAHIRAAVQRPRDVLPELRKVIQHLFGADNATLQLATNGPAEPGPHGDEAFLYFCGRRDGSGLPHGVARNREPNYRDITHDRERVVRNLVE